MKKGALLLVLLCGLVYSAKPKVNWLSYSRALELGKRDSMFVLVDVYADWCMPCRIMDSTTFQDSAVVALMNRYFYATKLNAESDSLIQCNRWPRTISSCVLENWELEGVPSFVLIGPSGSHILSLTQALEPDQMILLLEKFLANRKILLESEPQPKEIGNGT